MLRFAFFTVWAALELAIGAQTAAASPEPKIIGFGPDLIIVLSKPPIREKKSGILEGAVLQGEVVSETSAATNGWRSMRATFDISCADHADRVQAMTVFSQHNGLGEATALSPPPDWIEASQNTSYGLAVVKYFCGNWSARAAVRSKLVEEAPTSAPPPPALAPENIATNDRSVQPSSPPNPAPAVSKDDSSNERTTKSDARKQQVAARLASKTTTPLPHEIDTGAFTAQLGSTTVETEAKNTLSKLKMENAKDFHSVGTRIESADILGKRHYRIIAFGFLDAARAEHFCSKLRAAKGCLIRRGT